MKNYLLYGYFQGYSPETILETDEVFHLIFREGKKKRKKYPALLKCIECTLFIN